ncbi:MAG: ATP-binding protein [Chloroflexaceae bacterium]|nr:ATP-binding protein [Chloroflexaceae bacterium]
MTIDAIAPGAAGHFQLWFYAAVLRLIERIDAASADDDAVAVFPFLAGYLAAAEAHGAILPLTEESLAAWQDRITGWETRASVHLPLRALAREAGLDPTALLLLISAGLVEEDARFGAIFEVLHGAPGQRRPTLGLLSGWLGGTPGLGDVRAALRGLVGAGLLQVPNPDAPAAEWVLHPPGLLWECLQGAPVATLTPWARFMPLADLAGLDTLILAPDLADEVQRLPELLASGTLPAIAIRGPLYSGRRTLAGALARAIGRGLLVIEGLEHPDDTRWRLAGPLAAALGALPVIVADPAPGESLTVPALSAYGGPVAVIAGPAGGLRGPAIERGLGLSLGMPGPELRLAHWRAALGDDGGDLHELSARFRMASGAIRRVAGAARASAALEGRTRVSIADARRAAHALGRQSLDTLASLVPPGPETETFAASAETMRELELLATHCRHREHLAGSLGAAFGGQRSCGVRALFSGPSGTGKTLAARRLAAAIERDLYRIDLSAVVNKYIGETEKNLGRVLARAEELDIVLLLDEGDALLTRRTSVQSANDRYANLETNFLLQRLESFEGILVITTNAPQRIDDAFQRRMDVVISFGLPEPEERLAIWRAHLPASAAIEPAALEELAYACALSGGQIRNAARYAGLLALEAGVPFCATHLLSAVSREYRKAGAICPLRGW